MKIELKEYHEPEIEIIKFVQTDIITYGDDETPEEYLDEFDTVVDVDDLIMH